MKLNEAFRKIRKEFDLAHSGENLKRNGELVTYRADGFKALALGTYLSQLLAQAHDAQAPGLYLSVKTGQGLDALRHHLLELAGWQAGAEGISMAQGFPA